MNDETDMDCFLVGQPDFVGLRAGVHAEACAAGGLCIRRHASGRIAVAFRCRSFPIAFAISFAFATFFHFFHAPLLPHPITAVPRTWLRLNRGTPPPTERPTPTLTPPTEEEALEGYRRWVASLGDTVAQDDWFLRHLAPGEHVFSTSPRLVRLDAATARAVVGDMLHYQGFGWTPSGQGKFYASVHG
ncbi:MAG: hypothetical protein ACP5TV_09710, partial [Anaerolineae bacterium]